MRKKLENKNATFVVQLKIKYLPGETTIIIAYKEYSISSRLNFWKEFLIFWQGFQVD